MVLLNNKSFYKELFKLSLPIALGSLVSFSISLSDNMIISRLGTDAVSAVFLSNQIAFLLTMLSTGIEATVLSSASRLIGAKDFDKARAIASLGIISAIIISFLFFIPSSFLPKFVLSLFTDNAMLIEKGAPFLRVLGISFIFFAPSQAMAAALRSIKKAKIAFFAAFSAFTVNLFFNIILVFGKFGLPRLDVFGAGVATLIARMAEFSILFVYVFFIDRELKLKFSSFLKVNKAAFRIFIKNAAPLVSAQLVWSINSFFASSLMGHKPETVVAGLSAATALYNLSYVVTAGVSGALGIMVGRLVGQDAEGDVPRLRAHFKNSQIISFILGVFTAVFMQIFKAPFISFWNISGASYEWASGFINVLSFLVIGTAYQSILLNGFVRSIGDVSFILKLESFSVFCLIIPLSLLASRLDASPIFIFALLKCDQIIKCPIAYFKLKNTFKSQKSIFLQKARA